MSKQRVVLLSDVHPLCSDLGSLVLLRVADDAEADACTGGQVPTRALFTDTIVLESMHNRSAADDRDRALQFPCKRHSQSRKFILGRASCGRCMESGARTSRNMSSFVRSL